MKKTISKTSNKKLGTVAPIKAKKIKIVEEQIEEVLAPVVETKKEFKEGDVLVDKSSGNRFHFHYQSRVMAEPERYEKVG